MMKRVRPEQSSGQANRNESSKNQAGSNKNSLPVGDGAKVENRDGAKVN
jgi:hypothetical protein